MRLVPSSASTPRPGHVSLAAAEAWAESVSFWITRSTPSWPSDGLGYRWPQLCFGRLAVRVSKHPGGMLQIDLGGEALRDCGLALIARCPSLQLAPNGRMGVLFDLSWQPRGLRLTLQGDLPTEHRFDLC